MGDLAEASEAIRGLLILGTWLIEQVDSLRQTLRKEAATWRSAIYAGAYPDTGHELVDARMGRKGELGLIVATGGVMAPAEHVANASALRASLFGFFLAFWEHVFKERGGIATLIFDDPQELLDNENRERLAVAIKRLADTGAQLILTSYDERFATLLVRHANPLEHLKVEPATRSATARADHRRVCRQSWREKRSFRMIQTPKSLLAILWTAVGSSSKPSSAICSTIRRIQLGSMKIPIQRLPLSWRGYEIETKGVRDGLFSAHVFQHFVSHSAVADHSPVLTLMNKSHHGRRQEIRPGDARRIQTLFLNSSKWRRRWGRKPSAGAAAIESVGTSRTRPTCWTLSHCWTGGFHLPRSGGLHANHCNRSISRRNRMA